MPELSVKAAYDEREIARLPLASETDALAALEAAYEFFDDRSRWLEPHERIAILEDFGRRIAEREEELAVTAAREGGKPLVDSRVEVARAREGVRAAIEYLRTRGGSEIPMRVTATSEGRWATTFWEPRGVVLAISAFNHPFNLIIHQAVTAVAAGCPVLVKPARTTPLSARSIVDMLHDAGLPQAMARLVVCDTDVAERLVGDPRIAFLTFIGSARVGWSLRSRLAPGAACALEHGGVAPVIVDETANLDTAIPLLVKGGYYHAGQVCVSVQRVYVKKDVLRRFLEAFVPRVEALRVGDPTDASTEVGPLISPREVERVAEWVGEAIDGGGTLLCGGQRLSSTCYGPSVVLDPKDDAKLSTQEVFGPVVAVYGYDDLDAAVRRANAPDTYFQASVFTERLETALDLGRRLNGTAVMVNDHTAFRVDWMPFGGHRRSGLGRGGIGYSIDDMSIERMLVFRLPQK
jgi:acyl-CoA reductase-like NAD-dependent aldehyde dehydrogenase